MRGDERPQDGMFSYISLEQRVPSEHPLRAVRRLTDGVLRSLSADFDTLYADSGDRLVEAVDGSWWMTCHGYENEYLTLGRQALLVPIEWTLDGWYRSKANITQNAPVVSPTGRFSLSRLLPSGSFNGDSLDNSNGNSGRAMLMVVCTWKTDAERLWKINIRYVTISMTSLWA